MELEPRRGDPSHETAENPPPLGWKFSARKRGMYRRRPRRRLWKRAEPAPAPRLRRVSGATEFRRAKRGGRNASPAQPNRRCLHGKLPAQPFAQWLTPPANPGSPLRGYLAASLRSAEFGRAADAAPARASPASLTDGEDAVGTSRASARRTSSPIVGLCVRGEGVVGSFYASAREHFSQSRAASFKKNTVIFMCV